ncbi:SdrD B-like domain-containing protein [Uliginosibacterium sp. H3]|uniref:SdrD B-like domain-containing protein n=1 Tax=Uliginosibacterium silvisoli TaxID=3114758 RepID=A0ABU6JZ22_9RHOO|nr:SdrD B-like domain-containing protein [Uliginosibacterium sp. H3]
MLHIIGTLALLLGVQVANAALPAGTRIDSQATLRYIDDATGTAKVLQSNVVTVIVQPVEGVALTSNQSIFRPPGFAVSLPHRLRNSGNAQNTFSLSVSNQAGDDFDLGGLQVIRDLNSNGQADAGEPAIASISLAPEEAADLLISGTTPAVNTGVARLVLRATGSMGSHAENSDSVTVVDGAVLNVVQSVSTHAPAPGQVVALQLGVRNLGRVAATGMAIDVDGAPHSMVLLSVPLPANTSLWSADPEPGSLLLYHRIGSPQPSFSATPPEDLSQVDMIAYAFSSFSPGTIFSFRMLIRVNANAAGPIDTTARVQYYDGMSAHGTTAWSNTVVMSVAPRVSINYFTTPEFNTEQSRTTLGSPMFVQADAAACNKDIAVAETVTIKLQSRMSGDIETTRAVETGPNTGMYRIWPPLSTINMATHNVAPDDGWLQTARGDIVTALLPDCGAGQAQASLLIDPAGVVFDSRSNAPIADMQVQLIDVSGAANGGVAGGPARVFAADGVTPAPNRVTTGADGRYEFPLVGPSTYRLQLEEPGYIVPSVVPQQKLPADRIIDPEGSYGRNFPVSMATGAVMLDVPVDSPSGGLLVDLTASRAMAEIGDFVDYTVRVKNVSGVALPRLSMRTALPPGFIFQPGSVRRDGETARDLSGPNTALAAPLGSLANDATTQLTYRARIGPATSTGNAVVSAQAANARPALGSNLATATVRVEGGVFDNKAFALGKIYADCNSNGLQDAGEPGIPGVRIWLEDGTWVISDGEGKYSFYGLSPRTHVAKVDATTLPMGAQLAALGHRNAGDGNSRFLDLKNGELQRADFAVGGCLPAVMSEIMNRRTRAQTATSEVEAGSRAQLTLDAPQQPALSALASGTIGMAGSNASNNPNGMASRPITSPATADPAAQGAARSPAPSLVDAVAVLDNKLDFVELADRHTTLMLQTTLRIKGPMGPRLRLRVNGEEVAESRVGMRIEQAEHQLQAAEYFGVSLRPGENLLQLEQLGDDGVPQATRQLTLIAPGDLARIIIEPPVAALADGSDVTKIIVRLEDARGVLVSARTSLTLEASIGEWMVTDLDTLEPGTQVFLEGGRGEFILRSPQTPGDGQVRVSSGSRKADAVVSFMPPLRDLLASGLIEGVLSRKKLSVGAMQRANGNDGFEQEITHFSRTAGGNTAAARTALFLKGKVKGEYLLTLGYDSDKDTRERLFRDIQPDRFYPVYGDASVKGFDAQSTGHLYVRIDKGRSWLLYGDYVTSNSLQDPARNLAAYNRSLNGLRQHYENGRLAVDGFLSRQTSRQQVLEVRANGTSGPFPIAAGNLVVNSERIEIITRDRSQQSQVLSTVPLVRFSDYTLEALSGSLLLRQPVPSVDADLNDNYIRITYEVDEGGSQFWVGGVDTRVMIVDNEHLKLQAGVVAVEDRDPKDPNRLSGVNISARSGDVILVGEVARTDRDSIGAGNAQRIEVKKESGDLQGRLYVGRSDQAFNNPSSTLTQGRAEFGGKLAYSLDERTRLVGAAISTRDDSRGTHRKELLAGVERNFDNKLKLEVALHEYEESSGTRQVQTQETTSVRVKLTAPVPGVPEASVFGEVEQAVGDSERRMLAVGGDYRLASRLRLYGRYEFVSSLASYTDIDTQRRNTAVVGIDSEYMKDGRAFSEYRARDAITGREAEAAMGLRNQWKVAEGVAVNTSFERINSIEGRDNAQRVAATALTGGAEYTRNPNWKVTGRVEWRTSTSSESFLNTLGFARKLNEAWTFLTRNIYNQVDSKTNDVGDRRQERFQTGFAYRDVVTNVWNALGRYEYKNERDTTLLSGYQRSVHILSTHANAQLARPLLVTGRYAGKIARESFAGLEGRSITHLLSARSTYDIGQKWDASLQVSRLFSPGSGSAQSALGGELGYLLQESLWLSVGYNVLGFNDRDLVSESSDTARGIYMRLRFKFDEKLFEQF